MVAAPDAFCVMDLSMVETNGATENPDMAPAVRPRRMRFESVGSERCSIIVRGANLLGSVVDTVDARHDVSDVGKELKAHVVAVHLSRFSFT